MASIAARVVCVRVSDKAEIKQRAPSLHVESKYSDRYSVRVGIATRGVRVCVRMFGFLSVFGIGYTDSTGLRVAHDSDCVA